MGALYACPSCARHVYEAEVRCPFCDRELDPSRVPRRRLPRDSMSRAAQLAFTVVLGAHVSGCASSSESKRPPRAEPSQNGMHPPAASSSAPSAPPVAAPTRPADAGAPVQQRVVAIYGTTTAVIVERICFHPHSATIPKEAIPTIDAVAEILKNHVLHVEVIGDVADDEMGEVKSLSERRAKAVLHALVKAGAAPERLTSSAQSARPRPEEGGPPPPNRCVRFRVVSGEEDGFR